MIPNQRKKESSQSILHPCSNCLESTVSLEFYAKPGAASHKAQHNHGIVQVHAVDVVRAPAIEEDPRGELVEAPLDV